MSDSNKNSAPVRVRFAPSPTGYLHIGGARTCLFNWLLARKNGGIFVLRIEDTDQSRHIEDSVQKILDDLRWLGLAWDEGPQVGGPYGPYEQSQRLESYTRFIQQLLESGHAYYALETADELAAMRAQARAERRKVSYIRPDPLPTIEQGLAAKAAGRSVVVRFKMPATDITVFDDILGAVTAPADQHEDLVVQKSNGFPTYHFACVVDDELMKISHVLRGQEHLMNTPKHIALQTALGFSTPRYAHLPVIFNMDGTKMSKRDKERAIKQGTPPLEIEVHDFRVAGYLPEAVLNFTALLGWSSGDGRERFTLNELVEAFDVARIGKTNARFDREKLLAFNTEWAARLPAERVRLAMRDFLAVQERVPDAWQMASGAELDEALRACAGFRTLADVVTKAGFLFMPDDQLHYEPSAVSKVLAANHGAGYALLEHLISRLERQHEWSAAALDGLLREVSGQCGVKLGQIAQPVRVSVAGSTISPAIGETLALLGKERVLTRIRRCLASRAAIASDRQT